MSPGTHSASRRRSNGSAGLVPRRPHGLFPRTVPHRRGRWKENRFRIACDFSEVRMLPGSIRRENATKLNNATLHREAKPERVISVARAVELAPGLRSLRPRPDIANESVDRSLTVSPHT